MIPLISWIDAMFGRVQQAGTDLELEGAINYLAPLTATRNVEAKSIDVGADLTPLLGTPLPVGGVFAAPYPVSQSTGASLHRAALGVAAEDSDDDLADDGTLVLSVTLPASSRCKLTIQADSTGATLAHELMVRVIAYTDADSITAVSAYILDHAIDGDAAAAWADELEITAAVGTGLALEITLTQSTGEAVGAILCAQLESRAHPVAP